MHVIRGLQGSGKSTLARRIAAESGAVVVSLDVHRRRVWRDCPPAWSPFEGRGLWVQQSFEQELRQLLADGHDVIVDRTNLSIEGPRRIAAIAAEFGAEVVTHSLLHVDVATCIARDAERPELERVGAPAIYAKHAQWQADLAAAGAARQEAAA